MGCCLFAILLAAGPRLAFILWWLIQPVRINAAFPSILWPILGVIILPWTTIMYVLVAPGGITGFDWIWLGLAVAADVSTYAGNGVSGRKQYAS